MKTRLRAEDKGGRGWAHAILNPLSARAASLRGMLAGHESLAISLLIRLQGRRDIACCVLSRRRSLSFALSFAHDPLGVEATPGP